MIKYAWLYTLLTIAAHSIYAAGENKETYSHMLYKIDQMLYKIDQNKSEENVRPEMNLGAAWRSVITFVWINALIDNGMSYWFDKTEFSGKKSNIFYHIWSEKVAWEIVGGLCFGMIALSARTFKKSSPPVSLEDAISQVGAAMLLLNGLAFIGLLVMPSAYASKSRKASWMKIASQGIPIVATLMTARVIVANRIRNKGSRSEKKHTWVAIDEKQAI